MLLRAEGLGCVGRGAGGDACEIRQWVWEGEVRWREEPVGREEGWMVKGANRVCGERLGGWRWEDKGSGRQGPDAISA